MIGQNGGGDGEFEVPLLRLYGYTSGPLEKIAPHREGLEFFRCPDRDR